MCYLNLKCGSRIRGGCTSSVTIAANPVKRIKCHEGWSIHLNVVKNQGI